MTLFETFLMSVQITFRSSSHKAKFKRFFGPINEYHGLSQAMGDALPPRMEKKMTRLLYRSSLIHNLQMQQSTAASRSSFRWLSARVQTSGLCLNEDNQSLANIIAYQREAKDKSLLRV
jgi:hypothetical protein